MRRTRYAVRGSWNASTSVYDTRMTNGVSFKRSSTVDGVRAAKVSLTGGNAGPRRMSERVKLQNRSPHVAACTCMYAVFADAPVGSGSSGCSAGSGAHATITRTMSVATLTGTILSGQR
jgi:hypothetical protein